MRLSKRVWLVVGIAVLAVVVSLLLSSYFQIAAEHRQLEGRLTVAQNRTLELEDEKDTVNSQRVSATSALASAWAKFPESVASIEYGDDLFDTADESKVRIIRLTASSPVDRQVGAITYSVSSFVVVVKGNVKYMLDFVHALRTTGDLQHPWSAHVKKVELNYKSGEALIGLDIYGYKR